MNLIELGIRSVLNKHFAGLSVILAVGFLGLSVNEKDPWKTTYTGLSGLSAISGFAQRKRQIRLRKELEGYGLDTQSIDAYLMMAGQGIKNPSQPLLPSQLPKNLKLSASQKALLDANKHFAALQLPAPRVKPTPQEMQYQMMLEEQRRNQQQQPSYNQAFDFDIFRRDPDQFPHILIVGATGDGKSTLAEYLGLLMAGAGNGKRYAVAPHTKPDDWQGFDGVFGGGRFYGDEKDPDITYDDLVHYKLSKPPSVAQVLKAIYAEMDRRYKLRDQGIEDYEQHEWFIDEIPAISSALKKLLAHIMEKLTLEARKVKIRLWLLAQGQTVKLLGIEGKGEIRESFTYIYLGNFARQHAKELLKANDINPEFAMKLQQERWACMVEDYYAVRPPFEMMQTAIREFSKTRKDWRYKAQNSLMSSNTIALKQPQDNVAHTTGKRKSKTVADTILQTNQHNSKTDVPGLLDPSPIYLNNNITDNYEDITDSTATTTGNYTSQTTDTTITEEDSAVTDSRQTDTVTNSDQRIETAVTTSNSEKAEALQGEYKDGGTDSNEVVDKVLGGNDVDGNSLLFSDGTVQAFGVTWTKEQLIEVANAAIADGKKRPDIIKNVWKMGGKKYKQGSELWKILELPEA